MKYKLIKIYPGSPKLGSIVELKNNGGYELENSTSYFMTKDKVENYPEFWEEVVEKDYKILFINHNGTIINYNESQNDLKFYWNIHSIKRLSDGEIFTIGDKINHSHLDKDDKIINNIYIIEKIYFIQSGRLAFYVGEGLNLGIKSINKVKQPLFKTEDSVDIFKGDFYFKVINDIFTIVKIDNADWDLLKSKIFSTKEKAEEYVLLNKPCLSLKDLMTFFPDTYIPFKKGQSATEDVNTQQLEDLVKQKLK